MKKQFKKLALVAVFTMVVSLFAPAAQSAQAASKKTFTYSEQESGDKVTVLEMEVGEVIDLKFDGVSDWKNYTRKWTSSAPKVAVVDSNGKITAMKEGKATIELNIGDGSKYTSVGVVVYVDSKWKEKVAIGTASKGDIKSCTVEMGKSVVLKETGLLDNVGGRYICDWSSTDTSVAKIDDDGEVTPVAPGLTVIELTVTKEATGEKVEATPIALLVTGKGSTTVTPAPTEKPTVTTKPETTITPEPETPVITETPASNATYTARLEADNSLLLTFNEKVDYDVNDITLNQVVKTGSVDQRIYWPVADATLDSTGRQLRIKPATKFSNGEKYEVKVGPADAGTIVDVVIGTPNRLVVSYECMGKENVAYAQDQSTGVEVPVNLKYRIYSGSVDVTETYSNGYIMYSFPPNNQPTNVQLGSDVLNFYEANTSVMLNATYTYYDNNNNSKELKTTIPIRAQKLPTYNITGVVKYTIIDTTDTMLTKISWSDTTNKVVANNKNYKIVAMLADSYGNYFVTDDRAVDEANKIYSINDYNQLFAKYGYGVEFAAADLSQIIINKDGTMYPFKVMNTAGAVVKLIQNGTDTNRKLGPCPVIVMEESKLTSVGAEESIIQLASSAIPGYESRFCEKEVEILLKDQYGDAWKGEYKLELSSNIPEINAALDGSVLAPARLEGTKLYIDAENIKTITNKAPVSFTITETTTNKKFTITVTMMNPTYSNGSILVNNWSLGLQNNKIVLGEVAKDSTTQYAMIEAYRTSGSIKVGLYDNLRIQDSVNHQFTTLNCYADEVYVLVQGPDKQVVQQAAHDTALGVYIDPANRCVKVNVSAPVTPGSTSLTSLPAGQYTVTATRIISVGSYVQKVVQTSYFNVEDKTKNVTFRSVKSTTTPLTVAGDYDQVGVKAIVESVCTFNLDGKEWTSWNANMITNVDYVLSGNNVVIRKVEFAVPVENAETFNMAYSKTCDVNQVITIGVTQ